MSLSITLAQLNPTLGDLNGNIDKILSVWQNAQSDLIVFPELIVSGYPPEDLILNPNFIKAIADKVKVLLEYSKALSSAALITCPWAIEGKLYNAALFIHKGEIITVQTKYELPNYGVFDEKRVFSAGPLPDVIDFQGHRLGVLICEDMWFPQAAAHLKTQGAELLIVPNGSPWRIGKERVREEHARHRVNETGAALLYVNQVGGQDELVFDGASFVMNADGHVIHRLKTFEHDVLDIRFPEMNAVEDASSPLPEELNAYETIYNALTLGLRDYVLKNGFPGVVLGLSGGIDSALSAAIAVDALGADKVRCVMLPSPFTSQDSLDDAKACVELLGVSYEIMPIEDAMKAFESTIPALTGVAHENMQSRTRGLILMALSNASGHMLLTTGNKSEMAVGYATLYGDMNGGYNAIKDVYKTQVYALSKWRNAQSPVMPERVITKAPSAELRDNQTDQDSLPDYDVLDDILQGLIEREDSFESIEARGHARKTIEQVAKLLQLSEYKRYQAPPGTKITTRAFGRDRRYPMTNKYKFD